jgi:hypothetical protein
MPLSDDQRAMLRLLAQREQGYEDIAALMGLSVDEVRARVKDALAQMEEEGVTPPPVPEEPAVKEPAPPQPPAAEEPPPSAPAPPAKPAQPDPPVEAPSPSQPAAAPAPPKPSKSPSANRPRLALPKESGPRAAIAAGAAVVVIVIVALLVGGGGGGSSTTTATTAETPTSAGSEGAATTPASSSKEVTQAVLEPVGGGSASGVATFGRVKNSLALQVEAKGLEPTVKGDSYAVWLAQSPQKMLPLASTPVDKSGRIAAQFEVPTEVLAYLANGTFDKIVITRTTDSVLKASLAKATKEKKAPIYTGTSVLEGTVKGPIVGAALKGKE